MHPDDTGIELGHHEHILEHRQQVASAHADAAQRLPLAVGYRAEDLHLDQLGERIDGIERRAQIVGERGQRPVLGVIRFIRPLDRVRPLLARLLHLRGQAGVLERHRHLVRDGREEPFLVFAAGTRMRAHHGQQPGHRAVGHQRHAQEALRQRDPQQALEPARQRLVQRLAEALQDLLINPMGGAHPEQALLVREHQ